MKLEDLQIELDADMEIDGTKLQYEAANNPKIYSKWIRYHSACRKEMLAIEARKKNALKDRLDFYTGRSDEVSMIQYDKSELKTVMHADDSILKLETHFQYWGIMLEFCSKGIDAVKGRGFAIKAMIDIRSLESGK
ncbi:single stranded DNA-binding protein,phage-associated [Yersinia phage phiR1-RT]|uniref:Single stranded DNA-binding protein,phage-associated n=1 Tax=Yersinia phage phiR1-RT TaxID=1206558 RepID=I7LH89_BPPR1|nr:UvsY-like recombination mediator [Yersinia phage phiR1-RT]CCI88764.1 single stranded DNA-binding protein,phage-associated [Yersinia phage phiR1-RT]